MQIFPRNENGNEIDWWFLYKVPRLVQIDAGGLVASATGYEYVYFDPTVGKVSMSPDVLSDGKGALNLTLDAVFDKPDESTGWLLYNDEMPASAGRKDVNSLGHTKGVIAFDTATKTAFWLLHSWPKFADPGAAKSPTPAYGQTYICLSLDLATANGIAAQMMKHQQPQIYLPRLPASLGKQDPLFLLTQALPPTQGDSDALDFRTRGGLPFKVIAKNREWDRDFWNDLVGPTLKADMDVETWIRGPVAPAMDSDGIHKTFDIKFVDLRPLGAKWAWPESKDHAKWGITHTDNWVCIGDINRMISQEKRGGGTIAFQDVALWQALHQTDLLVLPEGMTQDDALTLIHHSHGDSQPKRAPASKEIRVALGPRHVNRTPPAAPTANPPAAKAPAKARKLAVKRAAKGTAKVASKSTSKSTSKGTSKRATRTSAKRRPKG